jgi:hypothetical protein
MKHAWGTALYGRPDGGDVCCEVTAGSFELTEFFRSIDIFQVPVDHS